MLSSSRLFNSKSQGISPPAMTFLSSRAPAMAESAPKSASLTTSWSTLACLVYCTVFTLISLLRIRSEPGTVAYIVSLYICFLLLYWGTHVMEKIPPDSPRRKRFKLPAWLLTTTLNCLVAYGSTKAISYSPAVLVWLIWGVVGFTSVGMLWLLFVWDEKAAAVAPGGDGKIKACKQEPLLVSEV